MKKILLKHTFKILLVILCLTLISNCSKSRTNSKLVKKHNIEIKKNDSINKVLNDSIYNLNKHIELLNKDLLYANEKIDIALSEKENYKDIAKSTANKNITVNTKIEKNEQ